MDYRLDLYAVLIFMGIAQAVFLSVFFFLKADKNKQYNLFQGLHLLGMALVSTEIFMMYTGYIQQAYFLVDFSESVGLALGPLYLAMVLSIAKGKLPRYFYLHFFPFVFYSLYLGLFLLLPEPAKHNAWLGAYHPDFPMIPYEYPYDADPLGIRGEITLITLVHVFLYGMLCLGYTVKFFIAHKESFWRPKNPALKSLRAVPLIILTVFLMVLLVKINNLNDTGDYLYAAFVSGVIYFISFSVLKNSTFFQQTIEIPRYKSSRLSEEDKGSLLEQFKLYLEEEKPFCSSQFSLPQAAKHVRTTVHTLSQAVNEGWGKTFNEVVTEYRIKEAQLILASEEGKRIKIEEVAERVGYSSKSSFNTGFKKITGQTPSEYRDNSTL
ncbi:helix-turn-helix domain-containing protein [Cytophagales bacterium LB-30]|uniref:Helix-turn-helix domain-containing protein n=1 Tax=Shiella aurantiaca TaxID=3058365 RepID=A0ABT8F7L3_9BACT|nr:helix-turn-helix domain-containing protein [Shiella aurantiaca]MDN4166224.1 helix-turn-helix domain-containing protein [Shiella aurantiaca]